MRELKAENQVLSAIQPLSTEPGLKQPRTSQLAKDMSEATNLAEMTVHETRPHVTAKSNQSKSKVEGRDAQADLIANIPLKQRRQTHPKPQSTNSKSKKSSSPPTTKAAWDVSKQLILDRFRQLERECGQIRSQAEELNQQSTAIQVEMEQLRSIAHQATQISLRPTTGHNGTGVTAALAAPTGNRGKSEPPKVVCADVEQVVTPKTGSGAGRKYAAIAPHISSQPEAPGAPVPAKLRAIAHSAYEESTPNALTGLQARGLTDYRLARQGRQPLHSHHNFFGMAKLRAILAIPPSRWASAIEALTFVFGAMGVRIGLKVLAANFPIVSGGISFLILLPAATAIYLALFQPKTSPVAIYRFVLITLGLLLGGKV